MKKRHVLLVVSFAVLMGILLFPMKPVNASSSTVTSKDIANDKYEPTGDPKVEYPQIAIRTNRTEMRTDLNEVIEVANEAADQYPMADKEDRAKAVMETLTQWFGSGSFGHAWIIIFNSPIKGDYTSYGYHEGYGFVKNGTASDRNDSPEREFHVERVVPLKNTSPEQLEKSIIPKLNEESAATATAMGLKDEGPSNGVYTPINNCSWFAGNLWNAATGEKLVFKQPFNGAEHAGYWGMPFLTFVHAIADPGMIAESIGN